MMRLYAEIRTDATTFKKFIFGLPQEMRLSKVVNAIQQRKGMALAGLCTCGQGASQTVR
jgi:hypothetical protein